jgi:transposase
MLKLAKEITIYVSNQSVDGRKSIDGLAALIIEAFSGVLMDGSVYVFYNQARNRVKCLFWDKNGFVLYQKRLERGRFRMQQFKESGCYSITVNQLDWLLAGLEFDLMHQFSELDYSNYF